MHLMIRDDSGEYYSSAAFGLYCDFSEKVEGEYFDEYYYLYFITFDRNKERLIRKDYYNPQLRQGDRLVIVVDDDQEGWVVDENTEYNYGCLKILSSVDFSGSEFAVSDEALAICKAIDEAYEPKNCMYIKEQKDIDKFYKLTGNLHDAYVKAIEKIDDSLHIVIKSFFCGDIEIWFTGNAYTSDNLKGYSRYGERWFSSSLLIENEFVYLAEGSGYTPENLAEGRIWFRGNQAKYRIVK